MNDIVSKVLLVLCGISAIAILVMAVITIPQRTIQEDICKSLGGIEINSPNGYVCVDGKAIIKTK